MHMFVVFQYCDGTWCIGTFFVHVLVVHNLSFCPILCSRRLPAFGLFSELNLCFIPGELLEAIVIMRW